jgi:hypothetical protein
MARYAAAGSVQPEVRLTARNLIMANGVTEKDWIGEVVALNGFVRDRVRYTRDVWGVETVQTPAATLTLRIGDCDDKATLLASLLMSIGFRVQFGLLNRRGHIVHVWTRCQLHGRWIDCETTEPVPLGKLPPLLQGDKVETYAIKPFDTGR